MPRISVLRDDRTAPAIVDADGNEVDVLTDALRAEEVTDRDQGTVADKVVAALAHEEVVVFDRGRPVRREAELETGADGAAPAGVADGVRELNVRSGIEGAETVAGDGTAALHVEQHIAEGIADLAGEEAERADARFDGDVRIEGARVAALEVGPVALSFQPEHPAAGLPAIADLTTGRAASRIVAAIAAVERATGHIIPALVARTPATVGADVETAPVVDRRDHRRRCFGVGTSGHISGRCGSGQCKNTGKT